MLDANPTRRETNMIRQKEASNRLAIENELSQRVGLRREAAQSVESRISSLANLRAPQTSSKIF
jgi:hypothetical protein